MAKEREIYEDKFYDALEEFKKEVDKADDPDLKRALYFGFKDYKQSLLEEYTNVIRKKKIGDKEPDMDSVIAEVLMFDNTIFNEFDEFRKKIESQIEIKSSNYNGEYNRFKKCPHCGQIWFKVIGCNSVVCGNRTKIIDRAIGRYKNYIVTYINNKVNITYKEVGENLGEFKLNRNSLIYNRNPLDSDYYDEFTGLTKNEKIENEKREKNGKIKISPIGCGKELEWNEMEDCSEEVIKKLKEISVDDYYSGILNISDKFQK